MKSANHLSKSQLIWVFPVKQTVIMILTLKFEFRSKLMNKRTHKNIVGGPVFKNKRHVEPTVGEKEETWGFDQKTNLNFFCVLAEGEITLPEKYREEGNNRYVLLEKSLTALAEPHF